MDDLDRKDKLAFALFWAMWKRDVSPPKLAAAIGKSADTIRRWQKGDGAPSVLDLAPLSRALGVDPSYFTNPPDVPAYPFESFTIETPEMLVAEAVESGVKEGKRRAPKSLRREVKAIFASPPGDAAPQAPRPSLVRPVPGDEG